MSENGVQTDFTQRVREALSDRPERPMLAFGGETYLARDVADQVARIEALLAQLGVAPGAPVALIARNRPGPVIALYAAIAGQRNLAMIYPFQPGKSKAEDLARIGPAALLASAEDWTPDLVEAARGLGVAGISLPSTRSQAARPVAGGVRASEPFGRAGRLAAGVQVLSSGTTGPPKRIQLPLKVLTRVTEGAPATDAGKPDEAILSWPLGGVGGAMITLSALVTIRPLNIMEKFAVEEWVAIIRRAQVQTAAVTPTMVRMILDANVARSDLSSLQCLFGGSAPLDAKLEEDFEAHYGIPVLWAYGATEFCGTAFSWTPDLKRQFGSAKRGSVGRALPGVTGRIVDPRTGAPLPASQEGLLETLIPLISDDWIRTTDVGVLDEDGFLYLKGRADGAINRGGFKILPEAIAEALRSHPAVFDAAVIGMPDPRLGEAPQAAVQLRKGFEAVAESELIEFLKQRLPAPQVPTRILLVVELPRTPSQKVSLAALRELMAAQAR